MFVLVKKFVGANAVIKQGVVIGKDVVIGAGTVVINDVENGKKIVGNPSRGNMNNKVLIAEAGVNHNGDIFLAKK